MKLRCADPKRSLLIYQIFVSALTLLCVGIRTANLFFFFDREINYYQSSFLPGLECGLLLSGVILLGVLALLWFGKTSPVYPEETPLPVKLSALLAALCAIVYAGFRVTHGDNSSLLPRALLILSVVAAVYFMLGMGNIQAPGAVLLVTGIAFILWLLAALASSYFDMTVQMNAPDKVLFLFACFGGMLFTVEELGLQVGHPHPRLYTFAVGGVVLFGGTATIPTVLGILTHRINTPSWILCHLLIGGLWLYAAARLWTLKLREDAEEIKQPEMPAPETAEEPQEEQTEA